MVTHLSVILRLALLLSIALLAACGGDSTTVEVSATPLDIVLPTSTPQFPTNTPLQPTPDPTRVVVGQLTTDGTYAVQAGDTLRLIAERFGVSLEVLTAANNITDPNQLEVGQVLQIPGSAAPPPPSGGFKTIPDSELVYGPTASGFDLAAYVKGKPGFLYAYSEEIDGQLWSGVELINRVALDYSVNPRLLLALLEYQSGWLTNPTPTEAAITYPYGIASTDITGLYRQLLRTANWLNAGYYGWRYRALQSTTLADGSPLVFAADLNAGTVAIQYFFAQISNRASWTRHTGASGFFETYLSLFGDPFPSAITVIPPKLQQPEMALPFPKNETWYFTGGPHGGYNSGSAWAAIDFAPPAPPDELIAQQGYCYISPYWVTASAPGIIARSGNGYVILDLDGDGDEHTGWTLVYLHVSSQGIVPEGTRVNTGDRLGHPSCEGGFSSATHLHYSRRYNGEWIPITCHFCAEDIQVPPLVLSGWTFIGDLNQEYQGRAVQAATGQTRRAEQGREDPVNHFSY